MADVLQSVYDALQAPYKAREAAGQVVTPGPVDWGGLYKALQAPYEARQARLAPPSPVEATKTARANYSPVGPGTKPAGGYSFLDDMVADSTPAVPTRLAPSNENIDLPSGAGLPPTVLAYGQPGKNYGTGAEMAIDKATSPMRAANGGAWFGGWGSDAIGRFLSGDPGVPTHVGGDNGLYGRPAQGFATVPNGPPIMRAAAPAARQPVMVAAPPPPNVTQNINRFLSEQGVNTQGMTAGEQANALRNAMGGSHNGEFH